MATFHTGLETGFWLFIPIAAISALLAPFFPRWMRYAIGGVMIVFCCAVTAVSLDTIPEPAVSRELVRFFLVTNVAAAIFVMLLITAVFEQAVDRAESALALEYDRAEGLLRNILPDIVAQRLKTGERLIADEHPEVSILFADIVNFTEASARLTPAQLVDTLNRVFTAFDRLSARHGAEKIKTIGDAYMAVVGVPQGRDSHAAVAVDLAVDMLAAARQASAETHFPIALRIGINSGPVVAGVIGQDKFAYDLWGDAVNVAARMETNSTPDSILITEATRALLPPDLAVTDGGVRTVKGKGPMRVFLIGAPADAGAAR